MSTEKIYTLPKGEHVWTGYYNEKRELIFVITTKENSREYYFLYELTDNGFKKLGKSRSPKDLEEKFDVHTKIRK